MGIVKGNESVLLEGKAPRDVGKYELATSFVTSMVFMISVASKGDEPGQRVVNCADPDAPSVGEICRTIAAYLSHEWQEVLLDAGVPELGRSPWDARRPIVLDPSASVELGYVPVGSYASTVAHEIDWLVSVASGANGVKPPVGMDGAFFDTSFDYQSEDEYLNDRV